MLSLVAFFVLGLCCSFSLVCAECKAVPGSDLWPAIDIWEAFNASLGGQLIQPTPPGSVCHVESENFNPTTCSSVQTAWRTYPFHRADPVSVAWNNYNNDTCIPDPTFPCSGKGYPAYVVNATLDEHVALGVQFAKTHGIRLIVKGTGHDYQGRYEL